MRTVLHCYKHQRRI